MKERVLLLTVQKSNENSNRGRNNDSARSYAAHQLPSQQDGNKACHICGKTDHVPTVTRRGYKIINYHSCEKFVSMSVKERFEELKRKNLCSQCLSPGFKMGHRGRCFDKYKCPDESHNRFSSGLHILVCDSHKDNAGNLQLLEECKGKCIGVESSQKEFSKNITISVHLLMIHHAHLNGNI